MGSSGLTLLAGNGKLFVTNSCLPQAKPPNETRSAKRLV